MEKPIQVLLVDDKKDYCESLEVAARHANIQIIYYLDWETGFEELQNNPSIEFVILDGKGKIDADQEVEKDNFVMRAIKEIDAYSHKIMKHIPYCVNTGFLDRFEALEGNVMIFEKGNKQRDAMFDYIHQEINNSEYRTIRKQFPEPFLAFDIGIIPEKYKDLFLSIVKAYNEKDYRKTNLNAQRDFLEAIFISLNTSIPCIPEECFKNINSPNHEWCTRFMEDKEVNGRKLNKPVPEDIKSAFRKLKVSTNGYSHLSDENIIRTPFIANTFLLIEILEWLPDFANEHYENYL
jgi:hypothetical protein